jgi:hypothetical protein
VSERFVSYAGNAEDVVLARALRPDETTGSWIDVGARHPLTSSVTRAFADRGWSGLNIYPREADGAFRADRPYDVNVPLDDVVVPAVSTAIAEHGSTGIGFLRIDSPTLDTALIDAVDWARLRPRAVVIGPSSAGASDLAAAAWRDRLARVGYEQTLYDGQSRLFGDRSDPAMWEALSIPANAGDGYVPFEWAQRLETVERRVAELEVEQTDLLDELATAEASAAAARALAGELSARLDTFQPRTQVTRRFDVRTMRWAQPLRPVYRSLRGHGRSKS